MTVSTADLMVTVAAHGLTGSMRSWPESPLTQSHWAGLLARAESSRLQGLLLQAIADGALPATAEQLEEAAEAHARAMTIVVVLDRVLLDATAALDAVCIPYRALKGASLAHTRYEHPELRTYGDIDLLVQSEGIGDALRVLGSLGFQRDVPQLRPGFDQRFAKAITLSDHRGLSIDLHRTLVAGPLGLAIDLPTLFATSRTINVGGRHLATLDAEVQFLLACYSAAVSDVPPRLGALRDVAQFALFAPINTERAIELAKWWSSGAVVARALNLTWHAFQLADAVPLSAWAARYQPTSHEKRILDKYLRTRRYGPQALASLSYISGIRKKVAFLQAVALPDGRWLEEKQESRGRWLRRSRHALIRSSKQDLTKPSGQQR